MDRQLYAVSRGEERALLEHEFASRRNFEGDDAAGKAGAECDHAVAAGGVDVLKHAFAGECLGEHSSETAADRAHLHVRTHPDHRTLFGNHAFAVRELADHDRKRRAFDLIIHMQFLLLLKKTQSTSSPAG